MKTALQLIHEERERQINVKGWTPEHDRHHTAGELANAAASYALTPDIRLKLAIQESPRITKFAVCLGDHKELCPPIIWPFEEDAFKATPEDRLRELAKAGALIVAEMERLMTLENKNAE